MGTKVVVMLALVLVASLLAGCSLASGNTASDDDTRAWSKDRTSDTDILSSNDIRLLDVSVDARKVISVTIGTCPLATEVGSNSCNVVGTP